MRARVHLAVVAFGFLVALPVHARASSEKAPGELGLLFGICRLDRDVVGPGFRADYSPVGGLRFGTNMDRRVSYFLEGLYGRFDTSVGNEKSAIFETRAGLERNFQLGSSHSDWYLAGALGYADANMPVGIGDFGRPLVSAGIGIRGPSDQWSRVHLELREEWWLGDNGLSGFDVANTQLLLGWSFGLRGSKSEDSDHDGVPDRLDRCPDTPRGTPVDRYGCPERRTRLFEKGKKSLVLEGVNFITDSAELTAESKTILNGVAESLQEWREVHVEIQGHTDSVASPSYNMDLSQRRAESVRDYLVSQGVSRSRLTAKGFGEKRPVASNDAPEGRAKNRRVELRKTN